MKYIGLAVLLFLTSATLSPAQGGRERIYADTIEGVYIPKDFEDAMLFLKTYSWPTLNEEILAMDESEFTGYAHFDMAEWIYNKWGLSHGSRLSRYFESIGVDQPGERLWIIIRSYRRHLAGEKIDFQKQVATYNCQTGDVP